MNIKKIIQNPNFKIFTNTYAIILTVFIVWMLFFDENSYLYHRRLNKEIQELEKQNEFYKHKIIKDKQMMEKLQDSIEIERYAREKYLMRKKNEDVFIIEFDTIK